jgi:hypothetical protein
LSISANSFFLDRIYKIFRIIFYLSHFPDGSEKTQSAFSGKSIFLLNKTILRILLQCLLITKTYVYVDFRRRRLGLAVFFWETAKKENPDNPVNPV